MCYHLKDENDLPFRENSDKNEKQIRETNKALENISERESYLDWMASLPITLETNNYRAVHAQWKNSSFEQIKYSGIQKFNRDGLLKLYSNSNLIINLNILLKGFEVVHPEKLMNIDISELFFDFTDFYYLEDKPVFFGHYWLKPREFGLTSSNTCCLDFSIVKVGFLASYRFSGESQLSSGNLVKHID